MPFQNPQGLPPMGGGQYPPQGSPPQGPPPQFNPMDLLLALVLQAITQHQQGGWGHRASGTEDQIVPGMSFDDMMPPGPMPGMNKPMFGGRSGPF